MQLFYLKTDAFSQLHFLYQHLMTTMIVLTMIIAVILGGKMNFSHLIQFSSHPLCPQDGTVPPSSGKRRPAPTFSLLPTL